MCLRTSGCNTAQRWHFRNLLNNWKSEKKKPTSERARSWLTKRIYIEKLIYFLKMNVFLKNKKQKKPPIQSLTDCTVKQCFLEDLRTLTRVSKITVCHGYLNVLYCSRGRSCPAVKDLLMLFCILHRYLNDFNIIIFIWGQVAACLPSRTYAKQASRAEELSVLEWSHTRFTHNPYGTLDKWCRAPQVRERSTSPSLGTLAHFISLSLHLNNPEASADLPSLTALNTQASLHLTSAPVGSPFERVIDSGTSQKAWHH